MAASDRIPPAPINSPFDSYAWQAYQVKLNQFLSVNGVPWSGVNKTGSNLADLATRLHSSLQTIQGGTSGEYYHLTNAQYTNVTHMPTWNAMAKPTITGSRGGNAALANLLTQLANYGLITDGTTV